MEHRRPNLFRSFCITLVLLLSLGLCGCKAQPEADTFFFQYEGYFAAPVSSTLTVAITGFSTKEACAAVFQNAASMSFEGNDAVRIQKFSIEPHESIGAYSACAVCAISGWERADVPNWNVDVRRAGRTGSRRTAERLVVPSIESGWKYVPVPL